MEKRPKNTEILTHLPYEALFRQVEKSGIVLPLAYLDSEEHIDDILKDWLGDLNPVESIQFSSFLNTICQTTDKEEVVKSVGQELMHAKLASAPIRKLLYHRDSLLHLITLILDFDIKGSGNITGGKDLKYPQNYYKSLMLISSKLSLLKGNPTQTILRDYFIRDYPYYYIPTSSFTIYGRRIQRYWFIYSKLLAKLDKSKRDKIEEELRALERFAGVSLKEYFYVIRQMLMWYLQMPILRREQPNNKDVPQLGFDYKNIESFYIRRKRFEKYPTLLKVVEHLSKDLRGFKTEVTANRKDVIPGFFRYFRTFFEFPFFKIDRDNFCIIDLRFMLEGVCAGLFWQVHRLSGRNVSELKDQYGFLMEYYFSFLLEKVFPGIEITSSDIGRPDAILETSDSVAVFEFTTEYYRFASLYNTSFNGFKEDLHKVLFNKGKDDALGRGKKDLGKFIKLNKYLSEIKSGKKLVPILVTENYLGDYDLLNEFDGVITKEISDQKLSYIQKSKPIIINLDDLETCWGLFQKADSGDKFINAAVK